MLRRICFYALLSALLCACGNKKNEGVAGKLIRFDRDLVAVTGGNPTKQLADLRKKYGAFFDLYCTRVIGLNSPDSADFYVQLQNFLSADIVKKAYTEVEKVFAATDDINRQLSRGFERYAEQFPDSLIPHVYAYVSGFSQPMMLTDSAVGVSLEMFLGSDNEYYELLGIARYKRHRMQKSYIPAQVFKAWAIGNFPPEEVAHPLISAIIHEGKLLYFTKMLLPSLNDECTLDFSKEQLAWCRDNEAAMWMILVENKLLYNSSFSTISRFTAEAPFTSDFSQESPGRAACWLGYRIVAQYAGKTGASLHDIMYENDYKKILELARYNP